MTLIATIKAEQIAARKNRNTAMASLLTTLIGEAEMVGKNAGCEVNDAEVVATLKKFIKNIDSTLEVLPGNVERIAEKALYERYLPSQMTEEALTAVVTEIVAYYENAGDAANVGSVMKVLKSKFDGQYDGKMASSVIKAALA